MLNHNPGIGLRKRSPLVNLGLAVMAVLLLSIFSEAVAQTTTTTAISSITTATLAVGDAETTSAAAAVVTPFTEAQEAVRTPLTAKLVIKGTLILVLFVIVALLIALRKLPAMIALPLMAAGIGLCVGMDIMGENGLLMTVLEGGKIPTPNGAFRLYQPIVYILFGGMFARFISDSKIAERIVKYAAEFGGEDPFFVSVLMSLITVVIFTATAGLPMIIMVGTVMFPILMSMGIPATVCGCILLMAFPIGSFLSAAGWAQTASMFNVGIKETAQYHIAFAAVQFVVLIMFLLVEFLRMRRGAIKVAGVLKTLGFLVGICMALGTVFLADYVLAGNWKYNIVEPGTYLDIRARALLLLQRVVWLTLAVGVVHTQFLYWTGKKITVSWNLLTPVLPLFFLLFMGFQQQSGSAIVPAFLLAMAYGVLTTPSERCIQRLARTMMNGVADVAAPIILLCGIGMLIAAATHPSVRHVLLPLMGKIMPTTAWGYLVFFIVASPLALYRGPLNQFGLGAGVAALMSMFLPAGSVMGGIISVTMLPDPTTTQNVWATGYLKVGINSILFKQFWYSVFLVIAGLVLAVCFFFPNSFQTLRALF